MSNPRIIAGEAKNRKLNVPDSARPMTDRIKQSIFDMLGESVVSAKVLDLYAGSGNLGIESLSRGAEHATFVETNDQAVEVIKDNLIRLGYALKSKVVAKRVESFLKQSNEHFDLIFSDPPFAYAHEFNLAALHELLTDDGIAVFRTPATTSVQIPDDLELRYSQKYGDSMVYFLAKRH